MVDFQKTQFFGVNYYDWFNHPDLEFMQEVSTKTGELSDTLKAKYHGLEFVISRENNFFINGSLHKYWNFINSVSAPNQWNDYLKTKGYNGNQFNHDAFISTLQDIETRFCVRFDYSVLHHLEFGVNVQHSLETNRVLDGLLFHNGRVFGAEQNRTKYIKKAEHYQLVIKAYDKALQYGEFMSTLRYELKYRKMERLNNLGIKSLHDITSADSLSILELDLLKRWDEIFYYDYTLDETNLKENELKQIDKFKTELFWKYTRAEHRDRHKKRYYELQRRYSSNTKETLRESIKRTWGKLVNCVSSDTSSNESILTQLRILNTHYSLVG